MRKNVGTWDAIMRISCGLVGLAWSASRGRRDFPFMIATLSAMKVAEGITRFCPMLALLGKSTGEKPKDHTDHQILGNSMAHQDHTSL
ncbi:DUF2892 domain-containing protein [Paenactinomyces guangxiensis]|uniref:DUF2892 domain-containing protein n=1 Tax=Paenactinomyces guangxiensis TaxID=1490290 RepID=A0A7W1WT25_9BACL|nr:DUF2892 domain-containing protein [Paenactinomyces guangxiensis]MBA4495479.1 DUF2892 domain-containing protein [Paenactinomyces guangxiensis]MBH8592398.1 DUF2892 domain-containing protein [Paenactinomyces guangxiensis]